MPETQLAEVPAGARFAFESGAVYRRRWLAFAVVVFAGMLDVLDGLITVIAAPAIRADIGGSASVMQWVTAGYTLALSSGLIAGGRLGDIWGHRRVFVIGMCGFTLTSFLCGVASDPTALVALRVLQGLCGAVMLPQGLAFFKSMFPPREIGTAFGLIGPILSVAGVCGPILGGWLIAADLMGLGWRSIFLVNLPLGLAGVAAALWLLPKGEPGPRTRLDWVGAIIVSLAGVLLIFPVVEGRELGWPLWIFGMLLGGVLLFGVFGRWEVHQIRSGGDPLVIPSLFRKRAFTGAVAGALSLFSACVGFGFIFTIYAQLGLGYSPLTAALAILPLAIGQLLMVAQRKKIAEKLGRRMIHLGLIIAAIGIGCLLLTVSTFGDRITAWHLIPAHVITGIGFGFALAELFNTVMTAVDRHEAGSASGLFTAAQQFAGALGVAILGTVFFAALGIDTGQAGYTAALERTLLVVWALLAVCFAAVFTLPRTTKPA